MRRRNTAGKRNTCQKRKIKTEDYPLNLYEKINRIIDINDEALYVEDLAEMLGVSKWGILKRIERGQLKAKKNGSRWYVMKSVLIRTLKPD